MSNFDLNHVIAQAAALYNINADTLQHLGGMESRVFQFTMANSKYVLRITPVQPIHLPDFKAEIELMAHLSLHGVSVPAPLPSVNDRLIETVIMGEDTFAVTAFTCASGRPVNYQDASEWNSKFFHEWGRVSGQIHRIANNKPGGFLRWSWKEENQQCAEACPEPDVLAQWLQIGQQMAELPQHPSGYGLIHNDLHMWNFHLDEGRITVFDFGSSGYHWYLNDIAIPLYWALWAGPIEQIVSRSDFARHFLEHFLNGYSLEHQLDSAWLKHLPLFLKHRDLYLYIFFTYVFKGDDRLRRWLLGEAPHRIKHNLPVLDINF